MNVGRLKKLQSETIRMIHENGEGATPSHGAQQRFTFKERLKSPNEEITSPKNTAVSEVI